MKWYLAQVPGGASAMLQTQAHIVLCFAVATVCGFLEVGEGCCVVPRLYVLRPCRKAWSTNTVPMETFYTLNHTLTAVHLFPESLFSSIVQHLFFQLAAVVGSGQGLDARDWWLCLLIWPIVLAAFWEQALLWAIHQYACAGLHQ